MGEKPVLNEEHLSVLRVRAISKEVALAAGLSSVDLAEVRQRQSKGGGSPWPKLPLHPVTGILIPYHRCLDGIPRFRVRSDQVEITIAGPVEGSHHGEETKKVPRYICQAGVPVAPYITKDAFAVANDVTKAIYITEAPFKALALCAHGLAAIGLGGVLAGAHDSDALKAINEIVAHQELRRLRWKEREVFIVFDAGLADHDDHPGNPAVALGAAYVSKALSDLGADVKLVIVPYHHPQQSEPTNGDVWRAEDQGPDDFIFRKGIDEFKKLLESTVPAAPVARVKQVLVGAADGEKATAAGNLLSELFFLASLHVAGDLGLTAVAAITKKAADIGKSHLKAAVKDFDERLVARAKQGQPDWMNVLELNAAGTPRSIRENVELCLRNDDGLNGLLAFDEFGQAIVFRKMPPWVDQYKASKATGNGALWSDADDLRLAGYLAGKYKLLDLPEQKVRAGVILVSRDDAVHPVRAYLNKLTWDQEGRLDKWLTTYLGVAESEYAERVGAWWIISAVARVMKPGSKVDHTLVLEGQQGLAKSTALRVLGGEWFSDADLGDLRSKEAALALAGLWILELAEGEIFSRASTRALKGFVTKEFDDIIPKFSNIRMRMKRQCVFALTTNDESDYLTDPTGNRRWWPVRCTQIDLDGLRAVRDQLWAEAVARYRNQEVWWPVTDEEKALCEVEQHERQAGDPWDEPLREALLTVAEQTTLADLLTNTLNIPVPQQGRTERLRVAACMRRFGWVQTGKSNAVRYWRRGPNAEPGAVAQPGTGGEVLRLVRPPPPTPEEEETLKFMGSI